MTGRAANPLLGTWSLLSWHNETEDGTRVFPLGEDATGHIHYAPDGFMFVHLSAAARAPFAGADPFGGSAAEARAAMASHITYAGPYSFHGDHVIHHVRHCSFPNWVGGDQVRQVRLTGDRLRLAAPGAFLQGRSVTAIVDWCRAG